MKRAIVDSAAQRQIGLALVLLLTFMSVGCLYENPTGSDAIHSPAALRGFSIIQGSDTLNWDHITPVVKPDTPFELHWHLPEDFAEMRVRVVHDGCGEVWQCGKDFPDCPETKFAVAGSKRAGVRVSGLPGGREYQLDFRYEPVRGTRSLVCRFLDLTTFDDTTGSLDGIALEPIVD